MMRLGVPGKMLSMIDSPSIGGGDFQLQDLMTTDRSLTLPQAETKKLKEENQRQKEPEDSWEKRSKQIRVSFV